MKKLFLIIIIFAVFLVGVVFASTAFYYTTNWYYKGKPVNNVRVINYVCNDTDCYILGEKIFDKNSTTNSITVPYPIPSPAYGYATYWFADCYIFQEMAWKPTAGGSWTDNVEFTKKSECGAAINGFNVSNASEEQLVIIVADIQSALYEVKLPPYGEPSDEDIVKKFLSAQTNINLIIKNSTNKTVYNETRQEYIYWDSSKRVNFNWTPTIGQAGEYKVYLTTKVPDCKCINYTVQQEVRNLTINKTTKCFKDEECDDGLYCNGHETCQNYTCINGTPINCSANNLNEVSTCNNNPDNNPFTWDYFAGFTSICNEDLDECTTGTVSNLTHTCDKTICGAECEENNDCVDVDCDYLDGCVEMDYYDYSDVANSCREDCSCTENQCGQPVIYENDLRCVECQTDDDCNYLDNDYCVDTNVTHDEGKCVNYNCITQTTTVRDCNDGLSCNGQETCLNAQCMNGTYVDCSLYNIDGIATCFNNPDNIDFTFDFRLSFISQCTEPFGVCTRGDLTITHSCDVSNCGAECEESSDCQATECDNLDGCKVKDYYDYSDVANSCLENCVCTENQCGQPVIYENDPRCTECQTDDDCNYFDNDYCVDIKVMHDEGKCVNYECKVETIEVEDCSKKDGITNMCGLIEWDCSEELNRVDCVVTNIKPNDDLCLDSCQGAVRNDGSCNPITLNCDYITEDCDDHDATYCDGTLIKRDDYTCAIVNSSGWAPVPPDSANCVLDETTVVQNCDDGLYCNGEETCSNAQCVAGTSVDCSDSEFCTVNERCDESLDKCVLDTRDCSANNLNEVSTCNNNPDNNPFTWDYFAGFTSICNEDLDECTTGTVTLTHSCDASKCGAECDSTHGCADTDCDNLGGCEGNDYYDYSDVANSCQSNCVCTENQCGAPTISYNDPRCTECQTDDDCNYLDNDYCVDTNVTHDEGKCVNYECKVETTEVEDCSKKDGITNMCGLIEWDCSEELNRVDCVVTDIKPNDDLCLDSCQGTVRNDGSCNPVTLNCDYITEDCDDWLWCNGQEACYNVQCVQGTPIDCSINNLPVIATCNNNPDNNPYTFDYAVGFTSECDEEENRCTTINGNIISLTHTCSKDNCSAECEQNSDCNDLDSYTEDGCLNCVCQHLEIRCFTDKDCYDLDPSTTDVCMNPGTTDSYCEHRKARMDFIPRQKFLINKIRINQLVYDEIKAGDLLFVDLNFENIGRYNTKYATIMVTVPELGISRKLGPFRGPEIDEVMSKGLYLEIPKDAKQGVYTARISLSDLNGIRRTRHRDFRIVE